MPYRLFAKLLSLNAMGRGNSSKEHGERTKKRKANFSDKSGNRSVPDCQYAQPRSTQNPELIGSNSWEALRTPGLSSIGCPPTPHPTTTTSTTGAGAVPSRLPYNAASHRTAEAPVDPLFIRAASAVEMVCGDRMYKCASCLRYFAGLAALVEHVREGWRDGYSCRVFYRKLKSMRDRRGHNGLGNSTGSGSGSGFGAGTGAVAGGAPSSMEVSGCMPAQPIATYSITSPLGNLGAMATDNSVRSEAVVDRKMDRVQQWLDKSVMMP
ncbi:uncharacterized protein LOC134435911 isoform X2 [Engraulis encrasicolus]|uniref:uncharacterized protein LOC134435911 isoform X2 n=1 Tax=Engraulis encrasicolus TaxID=184585 RepID=UPI002FCF9063